ncbi:PR-1-like protein [Flagelloscypha sp. PMI_526]|nr:PR-1-like protein [Flagelloscypha sp. PMI_526]
MGLSMLVLSFLFMWSALAAIVPLAPRISTFEKWQFINGHNSERLAHGTQALSWNDDLASAAQSWISSCEFKHYSGDRVLGENIVAGANSFSVFNAMDSFLSDKDQYSSSSPSYLHWSQVVWKDTTEFGCAVASCPKFFNGNVDATVYACLYNPPGNIEGKSKDNVHP